MADEKEPWRTWFRRCGFWAAVHLTLCVGMYWYLIQSWGWLWREATGWQVAKFVALWWSGWLVMTVLFPERLFRRRSK